MHEIIDNILAFNKEFVQNREYEPYLSDKYPDKKLAILSCMDARLTRLLPAALGIKNGDVKMVNNAGAMITHPFGSVMRSLLVGIYSLGVEDIMVIGHYHCGMQNLKADSMIDAMLERGIPQENLDMLRYCGVDIERWLHGFENSEQSVLETVKIIRNHPLLPAEIGVYGFMIDPETGKMDKIC